MAGGWPRHHWLKARSAVTGFERPESVAYETSEIAIDRQPAQEMAVAPQPLPSIRDPTRDEAEQGAIVPPPGPDLLAERSAPYRQSLVAALEGPGARNVQDEISVDEERFSDVSEGAPEGEVGEERLVRSGVGEMKGCPGESLGADHAEDLDGMVEREDRRPNRSEGRRVGARRARVENREELSGRSDLLHERLAQDRVRMGVQCRDALLEVFGRQHVVVRGPLEVLSRCQLEGPIEVGCRPEVAIVAVVPDPPIRCRVFAADGFVPSVDALSEMMSSKSV